MSTHRDEFPTCPVCREALDPEGSRFICPTCQGALVTETTLQALIQDAETHHASDVPRTKELKFDVPNTVEPARTCPRCAATMSKHSFYGITVDRCIAHGIWFDGTELQSVLTSVGMRDLDLKRKKSIPQVIAIATGVIGYIALGVLGMIAAG
jgi:Zn-finger nucleic acid-binding protein